jgi:hypothetical protein
VYPNCKIGYIKKLITKSHKNFMIAKRYKKKKNDLTDKTYERSRPLLGRFLLYNLLNIGSHN